MRVDEHTIEVAGVDIFYRHAACAGVTTLYLHSVPTSSDDWGGFLEHTGGIAPDLIGFGRSAKAGNLEYTLDAYIRFVGDFLDQLDLPRVKLVGHGWGAAIGLGFAQLHPDRIEAIALCNAVPLLDGFRWPRLVARWRRPVLGELIMGSTNQWLLRRILRRGCVRPDAWSDARIAQVWEQFDQGTQRAILRLHRATDEQRLAAAGAELAGLHRPALVIWGERDPWLPAAFAEAYAARLPEAVLERYPDAGHWPWLDQPAVIDRIASFLDEPV